MAQSANVDIDLSVTGIDVVLKNLGKQNGIMAKKLVNTMESVLRVSEGDVAKVLNRGSRSGRLYKRRRGKGSHVKYHQASARGEPPKSDSGTLVGSLDTEIPSLIMTVRKGFVEGKLWAKTKYAKLLEVDMDRPFLMATMEKNKQKIFKAFVKALS